MLDAGNGAKLPHRARRQRGKFTEPGFPLPLKRNPTLIEPVHRGRNFPSDLVSKPSPAVLAVAHSRPEGHIKADAIKIEELALLLDPGSNVLSIG